MNTVSSLFIFAFMMAAAIFLIKNKKHKKIIIISGAVILVLEIFVFNFPSFGHLFGHYKESPIDLKSSTVLITGKSGDPLSGDSETGVTIEIPSLSQPVYDLKLDLDFNPSSEEDPGTSFVNVEVDAKDETQRARERYAVAEGAVIRNDAHSSFLRLNLSGNVYMLRIRFVSSQSGFTVRGVTLNAPIPLHFSIIRSSLLFCAVFLFWFFLSLMRSGENHGEQPLRLRRLVFYSTLIFILGAFALMHISFYDDYGYMTTPGGSEYGNQITKELVDAFEAGQVSLLEEPDEKLLSLENPYDWSQRSEFEAEGKWDHLLYNGKYYSYYGIAPVLLLFLPFHLLTGLYFSSSLAVFLFGGLGIVFLSLLFLKLCDDWFAHVPVFVLYCSYLTIISSSGIFYCFAYTQFYEIAQSSGFMFTAAGFYYLLRSNVVGVPMPAKLALAPEKGKKDTHAIRNGFVVLSAVCLSLSVLCRPTLALYCVVSLVFFGFGFVRILRESKKEGSVGGKKMTVRRLIPYVLCVVFPFAFIGGVQMAYNYLRFGSILDFGIEYSLTINDFTRSQFHWDFVRIGFYNFLFAFPQFITKFPYVSSGFSDLDVNGYYFTANENAVGLFWRALPAWGLFSAPFVFKRMTSEEKKKFIFLGLPLSVIAPLVIIFSIWESGYGVRYSADFNWQILLSGMILFFMFYVRIAKEQLKSLLNVFFCGSAVISVWFNSALLSEYMDLSGYLSGTAMSFARLFDFWI